MNSFLRDDENKSHYVYINDFNRFMFNKTKQYWYWSNLEKVNTNDWDKNTSYNEKYQNNILRSFAYKLVCTDDKVNKSVVVYRGPNAFHKLTESILEECEFCNNNHIMSVKDEEKLQSCNKCWICNKSFTEEDKKVRHYDQMTGKIRGCAYSNCNINLRLTKNVLVIICNLGGYDRHSITQEINNFNVEITVIPDQLEKHVT